jgi:hypothetical protein
MDVSLAARWVVAMEEPDVEYYGVIGQGPWQEVRITREPYTDGTPGMRLVGHEPTGVVYETWRAVIRALAEKNGAIARGIDARGIDR